MIVKNDTEKDLICEITEANNRNIRLLKGVIGLNEIDKVNIESVRENLIWINQKLTKFEVVCE